MTIDVIESLLACGRVDQDDLARRFAKSYRWSRGYGPGAAKVLRRIRRGQPWQEANSSV
jgi:poly(ADP-ribose) glycohydrolase ARH3